ncbi:MAG: hypothetical protein OWS74_07970, partial [Firmicutes bacterium]|nr:hypothetical protein [Bacillota bacterium]
GASSNERERLAQDIYHLCIEKGWPARIISAASALESLPPKDLRKTRRRTCGIWSARFLTEIGLWQMIATHLLQPLQKSGILLLLTDNPWRLWATAVSHGLDKDWAWQIAQSLPFPRMVIASQDLPETVALRDLHQQDNWDCWESGEEPGTPFTRFTQMQHTVSTLLIPLQSDSRWYFWPQAALSLAEIFASQEAPFLPSSDRKED